MSGHVLSLFEDDLVAGARIALPATPRVLYVLAGEIELGGARGGRIGPHAAWHGTTSRTAVAGPHGACVLRYELTRATADTDVAGPGVRSRLSLQRPLALDGSHAYLMRCDRVDFGPGGEALPHGHRGGGIRRLLEGTLEVKIGDGAGRTMRAGDAWFESGVEPVHAVASRESPTSFVRVSILPREIRGKTSIVYVDPAHASVKPRQYTVHVDEPIDLP